MYEHYVVGTLAALLLYSYRYRITRLFQLNFRAIAGSGSASQRIAEQSQKINEFRESAAGKLKDALDVHKDIDHVDHLLG